MAKEKIYTAEEAKIKEYVDQQLHYLGNYVKSLVKSSGLTMKEFAAAMEVSLSTAKRMLSGKYNFRLKKIIKLEELFGIAIIDRTI